MSDTPRTDECLAGVGHGNAIEYLARANKFETALDRANARIAELEKDKARLDWLDHNAVIRNRWLVLMERDENEEETLRWAGVEWAGVAPEDVRSSIDDAMLVERAKTQVL